MTIQEMRERKKELGYSYAQIAELSGVPVGTVQKVLGGITTSPRYDTLMALEKVLSPKKVHMVSDTAVRYQAKRQGDYTLEDYYQLPEDKRAELIDGWIYDMSAPTSAHQLIVNFISAKLFQYVTSHNGNCIPITSPIDVQLDCDDRTMIQPDIVVVCDRDKIINRCIYGAPDLIIEVLSPATRKRDTVIKLSKYLHAGVREYWIIDPDKKIILVYDFEHNSYPTIYGFNNTIPVSIWDGKFEIDFNEVYNYIRFLYERV
ncbi:MAG: Uma2 family endonuclease [Lachnospiraceae bacterium]|nr:Uma2 family endonuclease [Lachnospiraceae bacterium]